jgi:hypothetical protein
MNNLIAQPADYVDRKTTRPDYDQYCNQTPVPIETASNWALTNWTIATKFLTAAAIAQNSEAIISIPGMLAGHQHKVTVVVASTDEDIDVYVSGSKIGTISAAGTYTYYVKADRSNQLMFKNPGIAGLTASITSVVVEGRDPWNENLLPVQA